MTQDDNLTPAKTEILEKISGSLEVEINPNGAEDSLHGSFVCGSGGPKSETDLKGIHLQLTFVRLFASLGCHTKELVTRKILIAQLYWP